VKLISLLLLVAIVLLIIFPEVFDFKLSAETAPELAKVPDDTLSLPPESPEVVLGDRLFFESRFSQFFFAHYKGNVNARLESGDPLMNEVSVRSGPSLPGRFKGQSMNCRQCHAGDDLLTESSLAQRTYCDFDQRSSIPLRDDGLSRTVRNAPIMINLVLPREVPVLFHYDGEFSSAEDLIIDTLTGRNFGWLPEETPVAVSHIAKIIREDSGINPRHVRDTQAEGIPYRVVMLGTANAIPAYLRIPAEYRIDVTKANDVEIVKTVGKLIQAYMNSLRFGTQNTRRQSGSPYDLFLQKNKLPTSPEKSESEIAYSQRLLRLINQRAQFEWVTSKDGRFQLHSQDYQFGSTELEGLKIFFSTEGLPGRSVGNCVACHTPPQFTDYRFHNNGVSQMEYDTIFGQDTFSAMNVPAFAVRNADFDTYLPSSPKHPKATGRFRSAPSADKPGYADLGVWNIFANPDLPNPQAALTKILCEPIGHVAKPCAPERILPFTIALFKTPAIRDLGHSDPYFHSGNIDIIEDVLHFYITTSELARDGKIRNACPELLRIKIDTTDVVPLAAFLRSLNEDYH
jgi:cytochrome c peroxidase